MDLPTCRSRMTRASVSRLRLPFCSSTHRAKASPPTEISDQMKGAMLGKLFVELSDGGITTTEWKVGRVVDVTAITVTAPDGTQQVNKHTAKWRGTVAVTNTSSH